jgi:hypothetical protein
VLVTRYIQTVPELGQKTVQQSVNHGMRARDPMRVMEFDIFDEVRVVGNQTMKGSLNSAREKSVALGIWIMSI